MSMPGGPRTDTVSGQFELMDRIYRHQRHIYDLTRRHYLAGRDRMIRDIKARPGERILEVGCGTARNLIRTARRYPGTSLWGVDASAEMLRSAAQSADRAGLSQRIALAHGLAEDVPSLFAGTEGFDHVIFSYSLSMIGDWKAALGAAAKIARPDARMHLVDFGDLAGLWPPAAAALRRWLAMFHVSPRSEFVQCLETFVQGRSDCALHLLRGRYAFVFTASIPAISALTEIVTVSQ